MVLGKSLNMIHWCEDTNNKCNEKSFGEEGLGGVGGTSRQLASLGLGDGRKLWLLIAMLKCSLTPEGQGKGGSAEFLSVNQIFISLSGL